MPGENEHKEIRELLKENQELLEENNKLLRRLNKMSTIGLVMRTIWYAALIGLPFALYFYVLEPYFTAFGSDFELFRQGLGELPGLKSIDILLDQNQ